MKTKTPRNSKNTKIISKNTSNSFSSTFNSWYCIYCGEEVNKLPKQKEFECDKSTNSYHHFKLIDDEDE